MKNKTISDKIAKLIDLKSIITMLLVLSLVALVFIFVIKNESLEENLFFLFSNITTMVVTYFFSRKENNSNNDKQ